MFDLYERSNDGSPIIDESRVEEIRRRDKGLADTLAKTLRLYGLELSDGMHTELFRFSVTHDLPIENLVRLIASLRMEISK